MSKLNKFKFMNIIFKKSKQINKNIFTFQKLLNINKIIL